MAGNETSIEEVLSSAKALRRRQRYDEAVAILLDALQCGVQVDRIFFHLGNIFFDKGDLFRAEYSYRRAVEENPKHINALHNLAVVCKRQGKVAESVKLQRKVLLLELRHKPQGETKLPTEAARWGRQLAWRGLIVVGAIITLLIGWLSITW